MKKLLLFTALLSASFAAFCPAVALNQPVKPGAGNQLAPQANLVPNPIQVNLGKNLVGVAQQPAATPLNTMIAQLLASITKPGALTSDIRLQNLATNVQTLRDGLGNVFVRDLDETAKANITRCIEIMQEEISQLLELFKETSILGQYNNRNCKSLLEIRKELGKMSEKINGVNLAWVAGKNTLSWMNNNRMKTVAIIAMAPFIAKATTTVGYHAYQSGFNPFRWIAGTVKWAITPAFVKATPKI